MNTFEYDYKQDKLIISMPERGIETYYGLDKNDKEGKMAIQQMK